MNNSAGFERSDEYQLDRQATACKKAGDWDGAIAALYQRKALLGVQWTDTKLAKYLQQAGRLDEAPAEVQWLVEHSQAWAAACFAHQSASAVQCQRAGYLMRVYGDAVLICKRAKRADLQAQYQRRQDAYNQIRDRLEPLAQADRQRLAKGWERAVEQGPQAMQAHLLERKERIARNRAVNQPKAAAGLPPTALPVDDLNRPYLGALMNGASNERQT